MIVRKSRLFNIHNAVVLSDKTKYYNEANNNGIFRFYFTLHFFSASSYLFYRINIGTHPHAFDSVWNIQGILSYK